MADNPLVVSRRILLVHAGGLGDLVLSARALGSIRAALADRHVTFCCRAEFAKLVECWPFDFDRIIEIGFRPYISLPTDAEPDRTIDEFFRAVRDDMPDTVVSMELAPTWLTTAIVASVKPAVSLARDHEALPAAVMGNVLDRLAVKSFPVTTYVWADGQPEARRYAELCNRLGVEDRPLAPLVLSDESQHAAQNFLRTDRDADAKWMACFFLGNPSVLAKRWPIERFIDATAALVERHGFEPILFGDTSEEIELHAVAERLRDVGIASSVFSGNADALPTVAAILARCSAFFGNDTGLAHLAAAIGIPGTTVYGGGTWPCFEPWAPATVGVVSPLPCFGCKWDCAFDKALCLDGIAVSDATEGFDRSLDRLPNPSVVTIDRRTQTEMETIGLASASYRTAQIDRNQRYGVIVDLEHRLHQADLVAKLHREMLLAAENEMSEAQARHRTEIRRLREQIDELGGNTETNLTE